MAKLGIYIGNVQLLEQLNQQIVSSGHAMSNIDANVGNYLDETRDVLEGQLDSIRMRLEEAEARLNSAENALSVCYASQVCNEFGELSPSCSMEECDVESARSEVDKWRMKYEQGQQILGECQQEIAGYSTGGHTLIMNMCEQQTPEACRQLCDRINKLQDILAYDVSGNVNNMINEPSLSLSEGHYRGLKDSFNL